MGRKIMVAGHACLDITPVFPQEKVSSPMELLSPGKLIQMKGVQVHSGGMVSNTGLALKKMGIEVCLAAKTGKDAFGKMLKEIYRQYQAEDGIIQDGGSSTSYSVVLAIPGIDRIFLHDPGANDTFGFEDIPKAQLKETSLFHFGYPPIMRRMYQQDGKELENMMKEVKKMGIATSMDMAAVDENSPAGKADWEKILVKALPYIDIFVPSIEEVCFMLDRERYTQWKERAGGRDVTEILVPEQDIKPLAEKCISLGAKIVILKCGAPGMYYKTAGKEELQKIGNLARTDWAGWDCREGFEKSYLPSKVLSGTGAGDTAIAAFLAALARDYPFEMCIHLAAAQGASCVEAYDAIGGLKSLQELEERISSGWEKQSEGNRK